MQMILPPNEGNWFSSFIWYARLMLKRIYWQLTERLRKRYRVELIDDETLSQSRQFFLRPITVAITSILALILVVVGTGALFVFTPKLHRLIPNYEDPGVMQARKDSLLEVVKSAENRLEIYEAYSKSLRNVAGVDDQELDFDSTQMEALREDQEANLPQTMPTPSPDPAVSSDYSGQVLQETVYVSRPSKENSSSGGIRQRSTSKGEWLQKLFVPLVGEIKREYNESSRHYGVDIVADENTLIRAASDGFVVLSEYSDTNGWVIGVATEGDIVTFYKHNSRLLKNAGTYVYAGEPIAVIGDSGENSSGMHLHFELWYDGKPVNPQNYLEFTK